MSSSALGNKSLINFRYFFQIIFIYSLAASRMYITYFDDTHLLFPSLPPHNPSPEACTQYGTLHFILKLPRLWFAIATSCGLRQPHTFILPPEAETVQQALPSYKDGGWNLKPSFKLSTSGLGRWLSR